MIFCYSKCGSAADLSAVFQGTPARCNGITGFKKNTTLIFFHAVRVLTFPGVCVQLVLQTLVTVLLTLVA